MLTSNCLQRSTHIVSREPINAAAILKNPNSSVISTFAQMLKPLSSNKDFIGKSFY